MIGSLWECQKTVGAIANYLDAARATAATNALDQSAYIAKAQEWLEHTNVSTTRVYDHRTDQAGGLADVQG